MEVVGSPELGRGDGPHLAGSLLHEISTETSVNNNIRCSTTSVLAYPMALPKRYEQVDSLLLDSHLVQYTATVVDRAVAGLGIKPHFLSRDHLELLARICVLALVFTGRQTPGQRVTGLRFHATRMQLLGYVVIEVITAAVRSVRSGLLRAHPTSLAAKFALGVDALHALVACRHLMRGQSSTVGEVALGLCTLRAEQAEPEPRRHASLSSVNTTLAFRTLNDSAAYVRGFTNWGLLARALATVVAASVRSIIARAQQKLAPPRDASGARQRGDALPSLHPHTADAGDVPWQEERNGEGGGEGALYSQYPAMPPQGCTHCGLDPPGMPQQASCGHVFCYVCVAGCVAAAGAGACPLCSKALVAFRPLLTTSMY